MKNENKEIKTYYLSQNIDCDRNQGFGWESEEQNFFHKEFSKPSLGGGMSYGISNFQECKENPFQYSFQLFDNQGWIGDYLVDKEDWDNNTTLVDVL